MTYIAFTPRPRRGVFGTVNRINFGMFPDLTEGANELIAMLASR